MSQATVIRLIHSLSKAEKRQFKLFTKKQSGNKDYLDLFELIDQHRITDKTTLEGKFKKLFPNTSLDNTARYLLKVLLDCLIQSRVNEQDIYKLLYGLLRVNILNERNLSAEAYKELNRLQELSADTQNTLIKYIIYREKLDYLASNNFSGHSEKEVVGLQMKGRDTLKNIRNTHEHYSLYELLKFRLIHSGKALSDKDKKQLNDLLLSEMSIVNSHIRGDIESRKLHLLFQSFFFTDIGDYKSALKTFHELNRLFEKNTKLWKDPPLDYFSALDGILDSLRTNGYFEEMDFYIQKLNSLDKPAYPEYFCFWVKKTIQIYRLAVLSGTNKFTEAVRFMNKSEPALWKAYSIVDEEKQHELFFYAGLTWYHVKEYKKAQKALAEIISKGKVNYFSAVYKAARLLNMIISYECKDLEYLDYEIRSYKRSLTGKYKPLATEKLIFKVIKMNPDFNNIRRNEIYWYQIDPLIETIEKDKYEMQIRKYFDFVKWVEKKFKKDAG